MSKIYLIVGCPGSGKTWVTSQLKDKFHLVHHDLYIGMAGDTYLKEIKKAALTAEKPLLIEAPFSISQIKDPLEIAGHEVIPVFIIEKSQVIADRYMKREGKEIPKGHLTRQKTYYERAIKWGSFTGSSEDVLNHLRNII